MIIDIDEARDTLRVDGQDNDPIIIPLVEAIPSYLEVATGKTWTDEPNNELAQTAAKMILQLWFEPHAQDTDRLKRTINTLLAALTAMARNNNGT